VREEKIVLYLTSGVKGVETIVWLNIEDKNGKQLTVTLFMY